MKHIDYLFQPLHWLQQTPRCGSLILKRELYIPHPSLLSSGCYNTHRSYAILIALFCPVMPMTFTLDIKMAKLPFSRTETSVPLIWQFVPQIETENDTNNAEESLCAS